MWWASQEPGTRTDEPWGEDLKQAQILGWVSGVLSFMIIWEKTEQMSWAHSTPETGKWKRPKSNSLPQMIRQESANLLSTSIYGSRGAESTMLLRVQQFVSNEQTHKQKLYAGTFPVFQTRADKEIHYSTEMIWGTKSHYFLSKISVDKSKEKTVFTEFHIRGWEGKWRKPSETI